MKRIQMAMAALAMLAAGTASAGLYDSWGYKAPIQFSGYNKSESLTNFPALVALSNNCFSGFAYSQFKSGSNDLAFTDSTGMTNLNYEIDTWNSNGLSYVWVQVPALASNSIIKAWWGSASQPQLACTTNGATWTNGYVGVWHMNQPNVKDSTANTNNGIASGGVAQTAAGQIGSGSTFGGNGYISVPYSASLSTFTGGMTVSFWLKSGSTAGIPISRWNSAANSGYGIYDNYWYEGNGGNWQANGVNAGRQADNQWHYYTFSGSGSASSIYRDGLYLASAGYGDGAGTFGNNILSLGSDNRSPTADYLTGSLDEVRVESVERSLNWVWACYLNMVSNGVFNSYGAAGQNNLSLPNISDVGSQNLSNTSASVAGTLVANGASSATVYLYWFTTDGTTNPAAWMVGGSVSNLGSFADGTTFTNTLAGLTPDTLYYWNCCASNTSGMAWGVAAGSPSFKTMGPPGVNNGGGAGSIGPYSATLRGTLTNGVSAIATIYCGTDTNNWTYTNVLGTVTEAQGVFSTNQTGLARNTAYYYAVLVSNQYGTAQSPATNFTTLPYVWITASATNTESQTNAYNGLQVVVDGAGVVLALSNSAAYGNLPVYQFGSLIVTNGASVVCLSQGSRSPYTTTNRGVAIQVSGDAIVGPGSSINADGTGFLTGTGPGAGSAGNAGGAHGGRSPINPLPTYGSVSNPVCLGSGGSTSAGGGAIKLMVAGNLVVNGRLCANGLTGGYGTGAGGSIWIAGSGTLGGTGEVQVSGGTSYNFYAPQDAGGGGRLAIDGTINYAFHGNIRGANGNNGIPYGDPGTVYFGAPLNQNFTVYANQTIVMGNDIVNVFSNLTVYGTLIPGGGYEGAGTGCVIQVANATVAPGGAILADGWGFAPFWGPAPGGNGVGGNHGGRGASNTNALYGSVTQPVNMGSGSRGADSGIGGMGGGAIKLVVTGTLTVNGTVSANGKMYGYGSGAGGSVWVTGGGTLAGSGSIQAFSPANGNSYGNSGGGRISIDDTMTYAFQGNIQAGTACYDGAPGTVYLPAGARSDFLIDTNQTFIIGNGASYAFGNLTVKGTLDCGADPCLGTGGTGILITANNLTVWSNGVVKANSRGFYGNNASSAWASGPGVGSTNMGATHAGTGYANATAVYGSAMQPTTLGSGGYSEWDYDLKPYHGGGAIKLVVANALTINGTLSANGGIAPGYGGSAGGSLWIDTGALAGTGRIQANGGVGTYGGGGGRIAIKYKTKGFAGLPAAGLHANADTNVSATVTVQGGYNVGTAGTEDGTIYISTVPQGTAVIVR